MSTAGSPPEGRPPAGWAHEQERSNAGALRLMTWIALRCGRPAARVVLHLIAFYFLLFAPRARRASGRYLARVFGRPAHWRELYRHFFCFASTILDRIYLLKPGSARLQIEITGQEHLHPWLDAGHGAFLVGAHLGSFEALGAASKQRPGTDIAMAMYPDNARLINAALDAIAPEARPAIIALGRPDSMLAVRDHLAAKGLVGVLADRVVPVESGRTQSLQLPFLGREAVFNDGPFRLAALLRQKVVFMVGLYLGGNRYQVRFAALADFTQREPTAAREQRIHAAVQRYVALLESLCREQPYNWFNFHDFWGEDAAR